MAKFVEEIDNKIKTTFKVSGIPIGTLKEFKEYCEEECGNVYAVGIRQLLNTRYMYLNLIPLLSQMTQDIQELKTTEKEEPQRRIKTFA